MEHWRTPYLGLREIPPGLDEFELTTFFSFSAAELAVIRTPRKALHRIGLALHIGFIRMTGRTLGAFERIPKNLWSQLASETGLEPPEIGTLRSLYAQRPRTLADHQKLAYQALGFQIMTEHQRRYVVRWLRETLSGRAETKSLVPELRRWFYEHRILQIGDRELKRLIAQAQTDHETQLVSKLTHAYGAQLLQDWQSAMGSELEGGETLQSWLWAPPRKQSTVQMSEVLEKIEHLRGMGVADNWPDQVNDAMVRHYARRCAHRPPTQNKRITPLRRSLETACFLRYALCTASDQFLLMLRRWIRSSANDAARETSPAYTDVQAKFQTFALNVKRLATQSDLSHADLKSQLCELVANNLADTKRSRSATARAYLIEHAKQARSVLSRIMALPLQAQGDHPVIAALAVLKDVYGRHSDTLARIPAIKLGNRWREAIADKDRRKALCAFEWATLFALRVALRNGSVYLTHTFAFRSQASLLISRERWASASNMYYGHLKLSKDPKEHLEPVVEMLNTRLQEFGEAARSGRVQVDADGMKLERQPPSPEELRVAELRRALFSDRPLGQLPEIVLEIDSAVRFSWILLGREPHNRRELLMVYAAVLAHGTSMSAAELSRMIPEVPSEAIRRNMKRLCDERLLRQASDAVVQYLHRFEIASHWGRANLASADMMSLETERSIWQARADPRRKTASVGIYSHKRDGWGIFYDQPVLLNERQAGVALEGMVRQTAVEDVGQLAVDTHGYTDFAMGLGKLLRCDLCPHLADIKHRQLHALKGHEGHPSLSNVLVCDLKLADIEAVYDDLVRIAASVYSGQCSAVQVLTRFGSDARGQVIYDGGVQYGLMLRTIYLIDYFLNPAFRGEVRHALNRGEATHTLYRAIHVGKIPGALSKRMESIAAVSSALSLLSNAVMAWNAGHMQIALDRIRAAEGKPLSEDLRRIAPINIEGINLRGTFDFPVERYAQRLLPSSVEIKGAGQRHYG